MFLYFSEPCLCRHAEMQIGSPTLDLVSSVASANGSWVDQCNVIMALP